MIIDDEIAIIGSSLINDRSLMGDRNTEICIIIEDNDKVIKNMIYIFDKDTNTYEWIVYI